MTLHRLASCLFAFTALLALNPAAHAFDDNGAKAVISKFIGSQKIQEAQASPGQYVITDLDGDGRPDIVLLWDVLGPTWSQPKMSIFLDQGKTYRTLTTDLDGQTEKLAVKGSTIFVDTLTPGPNDPRCCPTNKMQLRFQWGQGKLMKLK